MRIVRKLYHVSKKIYTCFFLMISFGIVPVFALAQVVHQSDADWNITIPNTHTTGAVAIDHLNTECVGDGNEGVVYVNGSTVYLRNSSTGALMSYSTTALIENKPTLVRLKDGKWYVFVSCTDGKLYKLDVAGSLGVASTGGMSQVINIRRTADAGCIVKDKIVASPVVQLESESNSSYTLGKDIVIVATHHGCSSNTTNMVYAFDAADIRAGPIWVFNEFADYSMDYCDNFILDKSRNAIFCMTNLENSLVQNTIWRINSVTGTLDWAGNFNSMHGQPVVGDSSNGQVNHLYAVDMFCKLHAINPDTGNEDWNLQLGTTPGVYSELPVSLGEGAYAGEILVTTSDGKIFAIYDGGADPNAGESLWTHSFAGGVKAKTGCEVFAASGKCFVGLDDGTVHQLNMATGADERYFMSYTSVAPAGTFSSGEPLIYTRNLQTKLVQSHWGTGDGIILQFDISDINPYPELNTWYGTISSAWENPGNWSKNMVPDSTSDVLIRCSQTVTITSNAVCRSLKIQPEANVTVNPGFNLHVLH
jgi:outer membrane protein assembly factor BamB